MSKDIKNQASENGKKRKRPSQVKENGDLVKEENGLGSKTSSETGSRRKNKPRRAAEVGVECR
nr:neurofilament medium polypeptide-like [Ipomoea batatas]